MSVSIVVPDDFPPALTGSAAEPRLRKLGEVTVHTERGADQEAVLIRRIGDAFSGLPTVASPVASGPSPAAALASLPDGVYAWRIRSVDEYGGVGAWMDFGGNPAAALDFELLPEGSFNRRGGCAQSAGAAWGTALGVLLMAAISAKIR